MATINKTLKPKPKPRSPILTLLIFLAATALFCLFSSLVFTNGFSLSSTKTTLRNLVNPGNKNSRTHMFPDNVLYWGNRIDCPGKHCESCEGLGHQESSLRCALEEAMLLNRTFVMPSRMCISPTHNKKGILHNAARSQERWAANSCAMDSLYDIDLISQTVPVILDNSKMWYRVLSTSMKLGARGVAHVEGVSRADLKENSWYSNLLLINRTASPLSWFMECKDRKNRSSIMLPYSFLPTMAAPNLRDAANKVKALLGDYDAIHVRRGDKIKTRRDRFGVERTLHPHLDRDTHPEFIMRRIEKWVPPGRTLFIASNERTPGFFAPLSVRVVTRPMLVVVANCEINNGLEQGALIEVLVSLNEGHDSIRMAYSSNFSHIIDPLIENNYQLFMIERLIMMGAKTFIRTYKEDDTDISLTDDPKKNTKRWQMPVYTMDEEGS